MGLDKALLRSCLLARRAEASCGDPNAGQAVKTLLLSLSLPVGSSVAGYVPMREEMDVMPALGGLFGVGHSLALPVVEAKDQPLRFRQWSPGQDLVAGHWHTRQPLDSAPMVEPSVFLVPLVGFDRRGYRLGYGGGFYDRTLTEARERRPVLAIGIAYTVQEVEKIPNDAHDAVLDAIITEREVIRLSSDPALQAMVRPSV